MCNTYVKKMTQQTGKKRCPVVGKDSASLRCQFSLIWKFNIIPLKTPTGFCEISWHKGSCGKIKPHIEEPSVYIAKWRKPIWKDYILYDSSCMTFGRRWNYGDSRKISGCHGFGEGGRAEQAECRACKYPIWYCNSGCISLTFVQTHRMYKTHGET